eukprot:921804-Alexandrium_andersonii.AAC.1
MESARTSGRSHPDLVLDRSSGFGDGAWREAAQLCKERMRRCVPPRSQPEMFGLDLPRCHNCPWLSWHTIKCKLVAHSPGHPVLKRA